MIQLEEQVAKVKTRYSVALRNLEQISEQIHARRGQIRASGGHSAAFGGRSSPVGAEADVRGAAGIHVHNCMAVREIEADWVDEKTRLWVERHRESGWGQGEQTETEQTSSDHMSVISLQTIASDLEKYDSVEHLGDLSDAGSLLCEEWSHRKKPNARPVSREVVTFRDQRGTAQQETGLLKKEKRQSFVKQHHRSVSL